MSVTHRKRRNKKKRHFRFQLRTSHKGELPVLERALAWVVYCSEWAGLERVEFEAIYQESPDEHVSVLINGEVKARFVCPSESDLAIMSLEPNDSIVPDKHLQLRDNGNDSVLCELPLFKMMPSDAKTPGKGRVVLGQTSAVAFLLLRLVSACPVELAPKEPRTIWPSYVSTKFQAAILFDTVDMSCWRKSLLDSITETEQRMLWNEVFRLQAAPLANESLRDLSLAEHREARSCSRFFRRDVARLLRGKEVEITRPRAIRCLLDVLARYSSPRFFDRFYDECGSELKEEILCATMVTEAERKKILRHFLGYLQEQYPIQPEARAWWRLSVMRKPEELADMLTGHVLTEASPKTLLSRFASKNPDYTMQTLLSWDCRLVVPSWDGFEKLSLLCNWLGREGRVLKEKLSERLIGLPPTHSTPHQQELVGSQLFRLFQQRAGMSEEKKQAFVSSRKRKRHCCMECNESFNHGIGLRKHQRLTGHTGSRIEEVGGAQA